MQKQEKLVDMRGADRLFHCFSFGYISRGVWHLPMRNPVGLRGALAFFTPLPCRAVAPETLITGDDWSTVALDPGVWDSTVCEEGCCRFMAAWVREEGKTSQNRQRKREDGEVDKVEVAAPGVTVGGLIRFRAALIEPTQGLPKRRRRRRLDTFESRVDWTDPRTPQAASAALIGKPENLENAVL